MGLPANLNESYYWDCGRAGCSANHLRRYADSYAAARARKRVSSPNIPTMPSPHTSSDPRKGISFCVEGWVRNQQRQTDLESKTESHRTSARHDMSDQPWTPRPLERSSSPSKRQRTSDGRHHCEHESWQFVRGEHRCEECYHTLPSYIFECRQCNIQACNRCRKNRL
jgi:hypothetical protein